MYDVHFSMYASMQWPVLRLLLPCNCRELEHAQVHALHSHTRSRDSCNVRGHACMIMIMNTRMPGSLNVNALTSTAVPAAVHAHVAQLAAHAVHEDVMQGRNDIDAIARPLSS